MINTIDHNINIDLASKINMNQSIYIKKNDTNSHKFKINIFNNNAKYDLTGTTSRVYFLKPDSTKVFLDCTLDNALDGKISCLLTTQVLTCTGLISSEITIYGTAGEILTSVTFNFIVSNAIRNDAAIESTSEFTSLTNALNAVNEAVESIPTVEALNTTLQSNIVTGDTLKEVLETDIATGNTLKTNLEADIVTAGTKKTELAEVIATANLTTYASKGSVDAVTSQLAEKASQLNNLESNKLDKTGSIGVSQINKNLGKFDQTYMTDEFLQQIAGTTPVNAIPSDESLTTLKYIDKSVTLTKTDFASTSDGLYNKKTVTFAKAISGANGTLADNTNFSVTDFIPTEQNTLYNCFQGGFTTTVYYDKYKNYLSGVGTTQSSFTTPTGCAYVRGTISSLLVEVFQLFKGSASKYDEFGIDFLNPKLKKDNVSRYAIENLYNNYLKDLVEFEEFANKITYTSGKTVGAKNGAINYVDNTLYSYTEPIPVVVGEIWNLSGYGDAIISSNGGVLLDSNNNFVSMLRYDTTNSQLIVIPNGVAKMVVTVLTANLTNNTFSITKAKVKTQSKGSVNKMLDKEIANMHYAELTDEFTYTSSKFVYKPSGVPVEYRSNVAFLYSQEIDVSEGEIWRTIDYSITPSSNWGTNVRGIFLTDTGKYVSDISCDKIDSFYNTFRIPFGVKKMIVNRKSATRLYKMVDWVKCTNITTQSGFVRNSGTIQASTYFGYGELPVVAGEVYRIADVFSSSGSAVTERGIFVNDSDVVIKPIKFHQVRPYQWNDVVVPQGATKMRFNYMQDIQGATNVPQRLSINKAIKPIEIYADNSKLKDKIWCAFGDSITWYGEWEQLICSATGINYYNHGYSSGSIAENGKGDDSTYPVLCTDAKINAIIAQNPDVVTIKGGVNDKGYNIPIGDYADLYADLGIENKSTFVGGYAYIIKKLLTWKPTLQIIILSPSSARGDKPNTVGLLGTDYANSSQKIAQYFGLEWVDVRGLLGLNAFTINVLTRDDVHWSFRGSDCVAQEIERIFRKINWIMN